MVKLNILVIVASICAVSAFALPLSRQKSGTSSILSTTGKAKQVFMIPQLSLKQLELKPPVVPLK